MRRPIPLPIDSRLDEIVAAVRAHRALVITALPGAGKTTRVPPALAADGPVLVLQPRRVAARAIARRIGDEQGWMLGREVGWHVRFERRFGPETRVLVATEGVLAARLHEDPLAAGFATIVIDEVHERSLYADLALAFAREAWRARGDLRLVVMSATLETDRVAAYLDDCPVIEVEGRQFPIDVQYRPGVSLEDAVMAARPGAPGAILGFLPGAPEIRRAADALTMRLRSSGVDVLPLHGGLAADAQDRAIAPGAGSRVILATNLAETTVTVPDVVCVIDTGLHRVARYDAARGIDRLETERVSQDAADQRAGRAGRVQAGRVVRLWDPRDRLRPHREPEIARVDLAAAVLGVVAWGADPRGFPWFESPPPDALEAAWSLLRALEAVDAGGRLTADGRLLQRLPLHPRLGRMLLAARGAPIVARACALLSDGRAAGRLRGPVEASACDLAAAVEDERALPDEIRLAAREIERIVQSGLKLAPAGPLSDDDFRRAVLAGYPDRVARRRAPASDRFVLASGSGARLARESTVVGHEFIVAVEVTSAGRPGEEGTIRLATGIERDWLVPTWTGVRHSWDEAAGAVRAARVEHYGALAIAEHPIAPDPAVAGPLAAESLVRRGPRPEDRALLRRLAFAGVPMTFEDLVRAASANCVRLTDIDLASALPPEARRALVARAPATLRVPSGRDVPLEYRDDGQIVAAVKLQELFGLADSPRIGARQQPVTFELLSPAGRPVQVTSDLGSFWTRAYPEVRRQLRARYPKHPWPDDPWSAPASARPLRHGPRRKS